MGYIANLTIAMLLTSSLVLSPVLAARDRLAHNGERASDILCPRYKGAPLCPPPPSPRKENVAVTKQVCYLLRGEPVCVGPPPAEIKNP